MSQTVFRGLKQAYHFLDRLSLRTRRPVVRALAANAATRGLLNRYYNMLNWSAKGRFHRRYSKIFREGGDFAAGEWTVSFAGRRVVMPLRPSWSWLDWDTAVSIIGHDDEIKETYEALLNSRERPTCFVDVGANYGTHSLLFLTAGVPSLSFEPNPLCVAHFETMCRLNGVAGRWEQVAIGNHHNEIELTYLERDTWLGSLSPSIAAQLKTLPTARSCLVPVRMIDDYFGELSGENVLIKIDVQGLEREVIEGAQRVLRTHRPKVIFETEDRAKRADLFTLFTSNGYAIHSLPWRPEKPTPALGIEAFLTTSSSNFIAITKNVR